MIRKNVPKVQKILNLLIQAVIFVMACLFMYRQLFLRKDLTTLVRILQEDLSRPGFLTGLVLVLILMLVNWSIEAVKWRYLVGKVEEVGFFKAFEAVLTGISISSFMPNRAGDYFGRVFILTRASRIEGILITMVGSVSQLLVTLIAGSLGLLAFIPLHLPASLFGRGYFYYSLVVGVIVLDLVLLTLYFRLSFLTALKEKLLQGWLRRFRKFFRVFAFYLNRELAAVITLSLVRYLVFTTQFYLLMLLFGVRLPYFQALMMIALVYLIMTMIPTVALTELGIRGSVAIYIFSLGMVSAAGDEATLGILAASSLLWLINLVIPAMAGSFFIFRLQFVRKSDL